jgi:hypothetical protein
MHGLQACTCSAPPPLTNRRRYGVVVHAGGGKEELPVAKPQLCVVGDESGGAQAQNCGSMISKGGSLAWHAEQEWKIRLAEAGFHQLQLVA